MESGYKIQWTDFALKELADTYEYLELNFSKKELNKLSVEIERVLRLISKNPNLFPQSDTKRVRRVVIKKFNTMYYRESNSIAENLSFYSNRQKPKKS
jgi:plasmid stabilization system protein ParE